MTVFALAAKVHLVERKMELAEMSLDLLYHNSFSALLQMFNPSSRIYAIYLLSALVLAFFAYWRIEKTHRAEELAEGHDVPERVGFLSYVFDPKIWLHPSSQQDIKYFLANSILYYGLISQFLIGSHALSFGLYDGLSGFFGVQQTALISGSLALILYTLVSVLALDFGVFIMHTLFHRVPILWHFHKVHHSAEHLNPMTLFRMHPVDLALTSLSVMFFQALAFAGFFFLTASTPQPLTVMGLNFVLFAFYLLGYNLRHSHIWLNYPVWLSKILISPAQHQIHHSSDPKHFDRNMGLIFSFWDQLFGSHYIPVTREKLSFGLSRTDPNPFNSISDIYFLPFVWASENVRKILANPKKRSMVYTSALTVLLAGYGVYTYQGIQAMASGPGLPSVKLERLTWTEVKTALDKGYVNVIIPTGGTEQNGPFVALGKHNVIVDYTSQKIATELGKTLIAPVMAYVPEGNITPEPTGHMKFSGTISLSEDVYEQVLTQTAASLKTHGFKTIFILGDSGDSIAAQERVAEKLNKEWLGQGVRVVDLDQYYFENGQIDYLLKKGFSKKDIGKHAGIRDTSELLLLASDDVRLKKQNIIDVEDLGVNGTPSLASAEIGKAMLTLKINKAVEQAKRYLADEISVSGIKMSTTK